MPRWGTNIGVALLSCACVLFSTSPLGVSGAAAAEESWGFEPLQAYNPGSFPEAVAVGDVNSDGWPDALLTTSFYFDPEADFRLWIYHGRPDGTLDPQPISLPAPGTQNSSYSVVTGDFTGDGRPDAAVSAAPYEDPASNLDGGVHLYTQEDHALRYRETLPIGDPQNMKAADVTGDGFTDLLVNTPHGLEVWWQRGDGLIPSPVQRRATPGSPDGPWDFEVADMTGDGRADIVAYANRFEIGDNVWGKVDVYAQGDDSRFRGPAVYAIPDAEERATGIGAGDLNGDGLADVAVPQGGNGNNWVNVFTQRPDGTLALSAPRRYSLDIPETTEIADVTGDGRNDVVILHGGWYTASVLEQTADGALNEAWQMSLPYASHYHLNGLALDDVSGDGLRDIVIGDYNSGMLVARATGTPPALDTSILSGPKGTLRSRTAIFALAANRGGADFECSLDEQPFTTCESPVTYTGLDPGSDHTFSVRAIADGQTDSTPATRSFQVDRLHPTVTLRTDRNRYLAGETARLTVGVTGSETRRMVVTASRAGRDPQVLFDGVVPQEGLVLTRTMSHSQALTARHVADTRHAATGASVWRGVRMRLTTVATRPVKRVGNVAVYRRSADPEFLTTGRPVRPGACLRMQVQQASSAGVWRTVRRSRCTRVNEFGKARWTLSAGKTAGAKFRTRATFDGDQLNVSSSGSWAYFRFLR